MLKELGIGTIGRGFMGKMHTYAYMSILFCYSPPPAKLHLAGVDTLLTKKRPTGRLSKRDMNLEQRIIAICWNETIFTLSSKNAPLNPTMRLLFCQDCIDG